MAQKLTKKESKKKSIGKAKGATKRHSYVPMAHRKQKKSSSTPGRTKVTCVATPHQKAVCARARSYKWPDYDDTFKAIWKRAGTPGKAPGR